MNNLLLLLLIILLVATISITLSKKVGMGSILGLILTGVIIGPNTPGEVISEKFVDPILHFSEFGIVLLLFIIGLEMQPKRLWSMRKEVFGLGSLQILLSGFAIGVYFLLFEPNWKSALIIGLTFALSSTAFVVQILQENNEFSSEHGRVGFSILLMQDLAIVPLLALIPLLSDNTGVLHNNTPFWLQTIYVLSAILGVILFGKYVIPKVLDIIAKQGYKESFSMFVMLSVVFAAYLMDYLHLSMAMGAFIIGMMLSTSKYGYQIHASVESVKSLLMSIFFVSVGMSIEFNTIFQTPFVFILHVIVILAIKIIILFILAMLFGASKEASTKIAFLLMQGGEFGFVLFGVAQAFGLIDSTTLSIGIGVISVSMVFTPWLYSFGCQLTKKFAQKTQGDFATNSLDDIIGHKEDVEKAKVIVAGYGDTGHVIAQMLHDTAIPFISIDKNPHVVKKGKEAGMPVFFGDITDSKLLTAIGVEKTQMVIISIEHSINAIKAIRNLRSSYPMVKILARVLDMKMTDSLIEAGANWVVVETLESSLHIGAEALKVLGVNEDKVQIVVNSLRRDESLTVHSSAQVV